MNWSGRDQEAAGPTRPEGAEPCFVYKRGDESEAGNVDFSSIGDVSRRIVGWAEQASKVSEFADSPIEDILGGALLFNAKEMGIELKLSAVWRAGDGFSLVPQFEWSSGSNNYRSDFAICWEAGEGVILIECDGILYHSSPEQIEADRRKDQAALDRGWLTFRFTGAQINREPDVTARRVLSLIGGRA